MRAAALCLLLAALSCGGFKPTPEDGRGPGAEGARGDGPSPPEARGPIGGTGPGPWGALPSGYCCTSDAECRERRCLDLGGGRMCSDHCSTDAACTGGLSGLHCAQATGRCEPVQAGAACVPASQYGYGAKKLGRCCTQTWNGANGTECEGGRCDGFGKQENPFICTQICTKPQDCPGLTCWSVGSYSVCANLSSSYTCTP